VENVSLDDFFSEYQPTFGLGVTVQVVLLAWPPA
jgi:hypothetical protein